MWSKLEVARAVRSIVVKMTPDPLGHKMWYTLTYLPDNQKSELVVGQILSVATSAGAELQTFDVFKRTDHDWAGMAQDIQAVFDLLRIAVNRKDQAGELNAEDLKTEVDYDKVDLVLEEIQTIITAADTELRRTMSARDVQTRDRKGEPLATFVFETEMKLNKPETIATLVVRLYLQEVGGDWRLPEVQGRIDDGTLGYIEWTISRIAWLKATRTDRETAEDILARMEAYLHTNFGKYVI